MAQISVIHTTVSSAVAGTATSFAEVVESDALVSGKTYYIVCHGITKGNNSNQVFQWRLVDRTNSDAVLSNSTLIREATQNNVTQAYYFVGRITAGGDGGGIAFEQKSPHTDYTVTTEYLSLMIFDISSMDPGDFFFANDTTATEHDTTLTTRATVTNPDPRTGDEYIVWAWASTGTDSVVINSEMKLVSTEVSHASQHVLASYEGEDLTEQLGYMVAQHYSYGGVNKDITWEVQTRDDGAGDSNEYLESTIFGLRLNAFENFFGDYTSTETTNTSANTFAELDTASFTPDASGDVIVTACAIFSGDATVQKSTARVQVDGSTSPNTVPDSKRSANTNDGTDDLPLSYITKYSATGGTAATIDLDVDKSTANDIGWKQYTLAGFTVKLADGDPTHKNNISMFRRARIGALSRGRLRNKRFRR